MYLNEGDEENQVPPHWHYVSFGLSDLHGDGRVHPYVIEQTDETCHILYLYMSSAD